MTKMSSLRWSLLCIAITFGMAEAKSETTAYPVIPNHLLDCYIDDGIYHRANRMPSTFESFIDLIRKVERSPTSRNMNARELAMVLLHYLKLDGIQNLRQYTKSLHTHILPFAPSGDEYFKHRLTLVGLVAKIDQNYMAAVNETLTQKEMCELHFLLSYSVDPYKREDEQCSRIYENTNKMHAESRNDWDPYQNVRGYYSHRKNRRNIQNPANSNNIELNDKDENQEKLSNTKKILERRNAKDKKLEVEAIAPNHPNVVNVSLKNGDKDKFTINGQELLSAAEQESKKGIQSLIQPHTFGGQRSKLDHRQIYQMDENVFSGVFPGIPLSECPVVNGVIRTSSGPLAIGTVIAGIAAGLNSEDIPPGKLSVDPSDLESPTDRVKNVWGATLGGTVADTISSSALLEIDNLQILKGGWNDTCDPKWYLLKSSQFKHLAEVAIRGSLDGLLLGFSSREWTNKYPQFKLSQMLQTYYEFSWGDISAKNRALLRPKYAPDDVFRKQVHLMSLVLKKQKTNVLTVLDYSHIAREAVNKVVQYIHNMDNNEKSYLGSFLTSRVDLSVNTMAVIDSSWGFENLKRIFQKLREAQVASTQDSNLTIICGSNGKVMMNSQSSVDLNSRFTKYALQENCTRGMNLPLVFDMLDVLYRKIYYDEKISQIMNTKSQVVVLFPYEPLYQDNAEYSAEKSRNFRASFPDVRVMFAPNGHSESFLPLVKNPKDVVPLLVIDPTGQSIDNLSEGVKQGFQRLSRPSCGSYFDDQSVGSEIQVKGDVSPGDVVYYRLIPQYFYTVKGQATISIRSKQRAPLTVCHSREMERPLGPSPRSLDYNPDRHTDYNSDYMHFARQTEENGPVVCKTIVSETYKIELNNPCEGASNLEECRPLYISLSPPMQENVIICPTCRLPMNIQYEIIAGGLTCYNSAPMMVFSPLLMSFIVFLFLSNTKLF